MNPVAPVEATPVVVEEPTAPVFIAEQAVDEPIAIAEEPTVDEIAFASAPTEEIPVAAEDIPEEAFETEDDPVVAAPPVAPSNIPAYTYQTQAMNADEPRKAVPPPIIGKGDDGYHITVIEEKNGSQRNYLLLGAAAFALVVAVGAWGVSLFQKALDVGSIGDEQSLAFLADNVPMPVEDVPEEKKKADDKDGGGGGGGREEEKPVNQGDLANQTEKPLRPPNVHVPKLDDPLELPPASTQGNKKFDPKYGRYGDPNSTSQDLSNGPGTGGGIGTGTGTGQGSGNGTGAGSGSGSGYGSGVGTGNGSGSGGGGEPPAPPARVTQALKILVKQKPAYTDAARTNNVQGTVTLRVTFLASGGIGSITTVKGLPHGLTEQAIAVARNIRFEPEMVNGQPRTTTRPVSYSFTIY
jgi:periplasmic protein TonB